MGTQLIGERIVGVIVPIRDSEALRVVIIHFLGLHIDNIEKVRVDARRKVEKHDYEKQMVRGMEGLYYEVVELKQA